MESLERPRRKICIFDLDGVVFDVSQRLAIAESEARDDKELFWNIFLREDLMDLDKPRKAGIEAIQKCIEKGYYVLLLTGRPDRLIDKTKEQLERLGITLGENIYLIMRPSSGSKNMFKPPFIYIPRVPERMDSKTFKLKILNEISKVYEIVEIHEDDVEILKEIWKRYHHVKLYLHIGEECRVYEGKRLF